MTLKNKLGAKSHEELEKAEGDYVTSRVWDFESKRRPQGQFDAAHLKAIHRHLFQDVYEWAGHTRDERVLVELNGVHPFREGNGRTQRVFITELATAAGHPLDFSCVSRERMIQASIAGNEKNDPAVLTGFEN